jgi:threonylcarbamoyladenosine tRNA methylthiotransferase MtaB
MTARSEKIRRISEGMRIEYMQRMIGKKQRVLVERINEDGIAGGYGEHYLPVIFKTAIRETNRFADLVLQEIHQENEPVLFANEIN